MLTLDMLPASLHGTASSWRCQAAAKQFSALQEAATARVERAELHAACARLEAQVRYLHEALASVSNRVGMALPAQPRPLVLPLAHVKRSTPLCEAASSPVAASLWVFGRRTLAW